MNKFIALLRGINVGGHRKIKMDELRGMFRSMGFDSVQTYIQSGNVIFDAPGNEQARLEPFIESALEQALEYRVDVLTRTVPELKAIVDQNPFEGKESNRHKLYVTFLKDSPTHEQQEDVHSKSNSIEKFCVINRELYSLIDKKAELKPQFSNRFVEKQFNQPATTRNWRSVRRILELALTTE